MDNPDIFTTELEEVEDEVDYTVFDIPWVSIIAIIQAYLHVGITNDHFNIFLILQYNNYQK